MKKEKALVVLLKTLFFYSFAIWVYVIAMQIAHPESTSWTFTEWLRLKLDIVGQISFVISAISFFVWQYLKERGEYK